MILVSIPFWKKKTYFKAINLLSMNINNDKITKIGYLGDQKVIEELEKEIEQQSKIEKDN